MTDPESAAASAPEPPRGRAAKARFALIGVLLLTGLVIVPAAFVWSQLDRATEVTGTVLAIRARPPLGVESFDLLAQDGRRLTFRVGPLDVSPGGFDAPHLLTHQATGQAVVVSYRTDGEQLVAVRLADGQAPATAPSPAGKGTAGAGPSATSSPTP